MLEGNALWLLYASVSLPIVLVTRYLDVYTNLVKECPDYFHGDIDSIVDISVCIDGVELGLKFCSVMHALHTCQVD